MAKVRIEVIQILRKTAETIEQSALYQWGHMGSCNCGFLAQQITRLKKDEIHVRAMQGYGDWTEQLNDYCPTSGLPMDHLISDMVAFGFDTTDLKHLETLSDQKILKALPETRLPLKHNVKSDVVLYIQTWANVLESEFINQVQLPDLSIRQTIL